MPDVDVQSFTTADGQILNLGTVVGDPLFVVSFGNYGMPQVEYLTRRGYKQDGATLLDYTLTERSVVLEFHQVTPCTRAEFWDLRDDLIDFFRPNRGGPLRLTVRQVDNIQRSLMVVPAPGFTFPPASPEDGFVIEESITFIAYDPIWFDPTAAAVAFSGVAASHLIFPETFPIVFSPDGTEYTANVTYTGNWVTYPTITITGPYTSAVIENVTTGVRFSLILAIGVGEQRIVTLTPGAQSIVDASGNNRFSDLSDNSNLVDWNIRPAPMVTGGINQLRMTLTGGVLGSSNVSVAYNRRYVGI